MPFFPPGGGSLSPEQLADTLPWFNATTVYVAPTGDDANDGQSPAKAKKTGYAGYQALATLSGGAGGVLDCDDGTVWGGPVARQGMWLRDDTLLPPGWLRTMPITIHFKGGMHSQFGRPCGGLWGGSTWNAGPWEGREDRFSPMVWIVSNWSKPIVIENIIPANGYVNQIGRFGWDFRRANDGSIAFSNITSWARGLGPSTTILSASRTSNVTRLNFASAGVEAWPGMYFHLTSTIGDFTTGWYQATAKDNELPCTWIEFADIGANATDVNIGTWEAGQVTATVNTYTPTTILSATRTSGNTKLHFANDPSMHAANLVGLTVVVNSTDVNFASGTYVINDCDPTPADPWIQYAEAGANHSGGAIGTWSSHWLRPYDRVEVVSTSAEIPSCDYRVTAVTGNTFTARDPYGYGPRTPVVTVSNPGQYVLQDRVNYPVGLIDLVNINGGISPNIPNDTFGQGPSLDFGGTTDGRLEVDFTSISGFVPSANPAPPDRASWILFDGGSQATSGAFVRDARPNGTGIRLYGSKSATWFLLTDNVQGDVIVDSPSPPAVEVLEGAGGGMWIGRDTAVFDAPAGFPDARIDANPASVFAYNVPRVVGPGRVDDALWTGSTQSAITRGQVGFWAVNRVNADIPQVRRLFLPLTARYRNWLQNDPTTWTLAGLATATADYGPEIDPASGVKTAWTLARVAGAGAIYLYPQDSNTDPHTGSPFTTAVGDRWVLGTWIRDPNLLSETQMTLNMGGSNGNFTINLAMDYLGDGEWHFLAKGDTIRVADNPSAGIRCAYRLGTGRFPISESFKDPFLMRIPAGDMTDNEFAEYVRSIQAPPYYLKSGMAGTNVGQRLVAHGGLGTAARYVVGVSTGQITLSGANGKAVELFDENGNSLGVAVLQGFAINP